MVRAILFDCFGVIITDALRPIISELEASDPETARQVIDIIHANNRGLIEPAESNRRIAEMLGISVEEWRSRIQQGEIKDERVLGYIRELKEHYKTALVSNIGRQSLHRRFSDEELQTHFDTVAISGELGAMKPESEIYLHTAQMLGVEPKECVMVDDRETHCAGATAVGMQTILYSNFVQGKQAIEKLLADSKD
jgi:HAD superfamily hydrolase (TIGR01549 family)